MLVLTAIVQCALAVSPLYSCQTEQTKSLPFCDPKLPFVSRVADLLDRMELGEKLSIMGSHDGCAFSDGGVPRLDIPAYTWCVETNTGVSSKCVEEGRCATTFPSPAALAASFNRSLWRRKGEVQADEQRALFNLGVRRTGGDIIGLNGWWVTSFIPCNAMFFSGLWVVPGRRVVLVVGQYLDTHRHANILPQRPSSVCNRLLGAVSLCLH